MKYTHLKLWIASARHNFKWEKIPTKNGRLVQITLNMKYESLDKPKKTGVIDDHQNDHKRKFTNTVY